jgi:3-deoxy-D-manno-octulosonate 8-phosphate phosphatase (KDO 8-P phosphatase)
LLSSLKKITCFVFDVDGVLTNGTLQVMPNGILVRTMNIRDGYALQLAIKKGYKVWVISGGHSEEVRQRLNHLGITEVHMKVANKKEQLNNLALEFGVALSEILFMGDDMPDYEAMQIAGIAACPNDAATDIKVISQYKALAKGGEGCAREVIEKVLKLNNHWDVEDHIRAK